MKKFLAVLLSVLLVFAVSVPAFAAQPEAELQSGEIGAAFADFDMSSITDMLGGFDLSSITSLFQDFDISKIMSMFEGFDLSAITDMLGGLDLGSLLGGLGGGKDDGGDNEEPTQPAPNTNTNTSTNTNTNTNTNRPSSIAQTGDKNGIVVAFAVCAAAACTFVALRKKHED